MYFIADIQYCSNFDYIHYLMGKTNFAVDRQQENSIFYLFSYITQKTDFKKIYSSLKNVEKREL